MAATSNCVTEKKFFPGGIRRGDPKYSNSYQLIPVHRQMMAVEAAKEKFYCFLGIVHPTYYQFLQGRLGSIVVSLLEFEKWCT